MFDKPTLFDRKGRFEIFVPVAKASQLRHDLIQAGFQVGQSEEFGTEDLKTGIRTEFVVLEVPGSSDKIALRKLLRERQSELGDAADGGDVKAFRDE